jgi:hypothetical protein
MWFYTTTANLHRMEVVASRPLWSGFVNVLFFEEIIALLLITASKLLMLRMIIKIV